MNNADSRPAPQPDLAPGGSSTRAPREYLVVLGLLAATLFLFGWGIGSYPLWDPWEPKYAQAVREMQDRGEFITPYLEGTIRWTKPILVYWAMYVPIALLGNNELAARIPSVLAAVLGVLMMYYFVSRLRGWRTGLIAACILGTLPQYYFMSRQVVPDMLLVLFLGAAMGFFALARFGQRHRRRYMGCFYAAVALAFLVKGPVACVITLGAVVVFWMIDLDPRRLLSPSAAWSDFKTMLVSYHVGLGLIIFVAVAGPWYTAMLAKHGYLFIENFFLDENINRFQGPLFGHDGLASYYMTALFHGTYPWSSILPASLLFFFYGRTRIDEEVRQRWYYMSWFLAIFLLFTAAGTKLDHYIFPITPAVAVLVALAWESCLRKDPEPWVRPAFAVSLGFAFLPFRDFIFEGNRYIMNVFVPAQDIITDLDVELVLWITFASWAALIAWLCLTRRGVGVVALLAVLVAYGNGVFMLHHLVPDHASERSLKLYAERLSQLEQPAADVVFYGWIRHSILYYYGDEFVYFEPDDLDEVVAFVRDKPDVYIIVQETVLEDLLDRLHRLRQSRWTLFSDDHPRFYVVTNSNTRRLRIPE